MKRGLLVGAGSVGLVCGSVLAVIMGSGPAPQAKTTPSPAVAAVEDPGAQTEPGEAPEEREEPEVDPRQARIAELVAQLGEAHGELHADDVREEAPEAALPGALKDAVGADEDRTRLLKALVEEVGLGRFARGGHLTEVGHAVLERARALDRHAIEPGPYRLIALEEAVVGLQPPGGASDVPAPERAVAALLSDGTFDALRAARRLAALKELPTDAQVAGVVAGLLERGVGDSVRAEDVPADVWLAATALQLALDFRFVKKAGPEELRKAETLLGRKRPFKKILAMAKAIAEAEDGAGAMAVIDPVHPQYAAMLDIHDRYRGYAAKGGCDKLPESWKIRPGMKGEEVKRLQRRLACEGYYDGEIDGVYEGHALAAVKRYQRHHELAAEGFAFEETLESMNVPMGRRVQQIALVLQRMRESPIEEMGDFFIRVNLPAFEMQVWDGGEVARRHKVIVGTNRLDDDKAKLVQGHLNRTQLFTTELYEVIVHPTWILPPRVEHGELKGKLAEDPDYLEKHNIKKMKLDSGREVYIQGFGEGNVLGEVKFLLRKSNAIYLHDTDKRSLFKKKRRDFSHGCVRVDDAVEFAKWLLMRDGFTEKEIDKSFKLTQYQRGYDLRKPIPLLTEYMTVEISDEKLPVFLTDIYKYDRAYWRGELPPEAVTRWGAANLRPRWVPRVSEETVNRWRAEGKHAPRNYDPEIHGK